LENLVGSNGRQLIFLISQPRAGSTMLQRILGCHPDIYTVSEPWFMLHPLYALRPTGFEAEYNAQIAHHALQAFLKGLPHKEDEYMEGVRRMSTYIYSRALKNSGKNFFLDKTPRYYFILPELYSLFKDAHFIILLRNPLSVLCSIIKSWIKEDWFSLYEFQYDLVKAPTMLLEASKRRKHNCRVVHFEKILENPSREIKKICSWLQIEFSPKMISYGNQNLPSWQFGDQKKVYQHKYPEVGIKDKWINLLEDPQVWRVAKDYFGLIKPGTLKMLGYSSETMEKLLKQYEPIRRKRALTFSLYHLFKKPAFRRKKTELIILGIRRYLTRYGPYKSIVIIIKKVKDALFSLPGTILSDK
jgi:hypothetical protein